VAEWSKANDSKSFEGKPSVGSNPTLSVSDLKTGVPEGSRDVSPIPETHCRAVGFLLFGRPMAFIHHVSAMSAMGARQHPQQGPLLSGSGGGGGGTGGGSGGGGTGGGATRPATGLLWPRGV